MATTQERLDPTSPHYDEQFAELRRKAYQAYDDHKRDMENDPKYAAAMKRKGWDK